MFVIGTTYKSYTSILNQILHQLKINTNFFSQGILETPLNSISVHPRKTKTFLIVQRKA